MISYISRYSSVRFSIAAIISIVLISAFGAATTVPLAPLLVLCILATGAFFLNGAKVTPVERLILVPAVGTAALAISSLLLPLSSALGLVERPVHSPAVLTAAVALPSVLSVVYWSRQEEPKLPSATVTSRLVIGLVPAVIGGAGAVVQWQFGTVVQNYAAMIAIIAFIPALLRWAETELEVAVSVFGVGMGILLSHTLVTGYAIGTDIQVSIYSIERIVDRGIWPIGDFFFETGASEAPLSDLIEYLATEMKHTMLPVIIGVPVLFQTVGNTTVDAVFNLFFAGLFALVPVGIYRIGRERLSVRKACIAALLFPVYFRFFHTSPAKQHIAQFFMISLLVVWHTKLENEQRKIAAILLTTAIVFSHYAVTFLFFGSLLVVYVASRWYTEGVPHPDLTTVYLGYFYSLIGLWYVVIAGGKHPLRALSAIVSSVERVVTSGSAEGRTGASYATSKTLLADQINLALHGLLVAAIGVGVLCLLYYVFRKRKPFISPVFDVLSVCFFSLVAASMVITGHLGIDRSLDISLTIIAPLALVGLQWCVDRFDGITGTETLSSHTHTIGALFVVLMLVFSSGLAYEAAGTPASSAINLHENPNSVMYTDEELEGARWLLANSNNSTIYISTYSSVPFKRLMSFQETSERVEGYMDYQLNISIRWNETGYIYIRRAAITDESTTRTPEYLFTRDDVSSFRSRTETVYRNEDVLILRNEPPRNETAVRNTTGET